MITRLAWRTASPFRERPAGGPGRGRPADGPGPGQPADGRAAGRQPFRRSQIGFTLVEVTMTSALLLLVLAVLLPQLSGTITRFDDAQVRSSTTDQAQQAIHQIQHDVVASNVLYLSGGVVHLQVFNGQTSSTTSTTLTPSSTCVEYQVASGVLQRRTKSPTAPSWGSGWTNVMTGIVNSSQSGNPAVFTVSSNRSLVVNLWVNTDTRTRGAAAPSQYTTTATGAAIPNSPSATSGAC